MDTTNSPLLYKPKALSHPRLKYVAIGLVALCVVSIGTLALRKDDQEMMTMFSKTTTTEPLIQQCEEKYFTQELDHFSRDGTDKTYQQRYFVCKRNWRRPTAKQSPGPIFFYVGNEADVELYLNHTGLMWENSAEFEAMLVFAEHRYFGKSLPFGQNITQHMGFLSSEQALADYASLIRSLKAEYSAHDAAVIGFGGSYGGMLGSWFRMKYPHIVDGVIAASAPILSFLGEDPPIDPASFSRVTTYDASPAAGSAPNCIPNVRSSWKHIFQAAKTQHGRQMLKTVFNLCHDLKSEADANALPGWIQGAYDSMAMGNYPYPSSYIMNGDSMLPAFPVRVACSHLSGTYTEPTELLHALSESIGVFYNNTGQAKCYDLNPPNEASKRSSDFWDYLYCSEMCQPFDTNGETDMFWAAKQNWTSKGEDCKRNWGITPRLEWAQTMYGGRQALKSASNIVFSNGNYDPWSGFGVMESVSESVVSIIIEEGAHHLDLMFSNPLDPESVKEARHTEKLHMLKWVKDRARKVQ